MILVAGGLLQVQSIWEIFKTGMQRQSLFYKWSYIKATIYFLIDSFSNSTIISFLRLKTSKGAL